MLTRKLLSVIDNIIVDVFKIISESTDSFMVNVTVSLAQLPGHSQGTRFYSRGPCPGWAPAAPPLGAATDRQTDRFAISISRVSMLTRDKNWKSVNVYQSYEWISSGTFYGPRCIMEDEEEMRSIAWVPMTLNDPPKARLTKILNNTRHRAASLR